MVELPWMIIFAGGSAAILEVAGKLHCPAITPEGLTVVVPDEIVAV